MKNTAVIIGALLSAAIGLLVFQVTGLGEAIDSDFLKFVVGLAFVALYLSIYRGGLMSGTKRTVEEIEVVIKPAEQHLTAGQGAGTDQQPAYTLSS